ncbi:MAG: 3-oxoacyl-[acyl-carrier-protein] reductase [Ammonifex sp.]|jgi:3-oxoacyl-[acyl-carrier protein] reductase|nr:MAG: 3-oxoacyl-[acyl-carrier-protein] reductase [Ammonifex sp.]
MYLSGKVGVVTGASRGIGRAVAKALAASGADVMINYVSRAEDALAVAAEIESMGRRAVLFQADVSRPDEANNLIENALSSFGRLDILVNNAGITRDALLLRMKDEDWDAVVNVNLRGAFNCTRAAARPMVKARWGRIINISSVIGLMGNAGQANYAAAKAGLIGFTKAAARELGPRNITVNAVAPGFIRTEMTAGLPEGVKERLSERIILGRLGEPEEVAEVVVFLAGDAARYITGQVLSVDGGMVL